MCHDLPACGEENETMSLLYADDTKFAQSIQSDNDSTKLQKSIDKLSLWSTTNRLQLNLNKCKYVRYTRKPNTINLRQYYIGANVIEEVKQHIDLGVLFDNELTFKPHIDQLTSKMRSLYGAGYRFAKEVGHMSILKKITRTYILPVLEFSSMVWDQHRIGCNEQLERVLHQMSRAVLNRPFVVRHPRYIDFEARISQLNLLTLTERRIIQSIIIIIKIQRGILKSQLVQSIQRAVPHNIHRTCRPTTSIQHQYEYFCGKEPNQHSYDKLQHV